MLLAEPTPVITTAQLFPLLATAVGVPARFRATSGNAIGILMGPVPRHAHNPFRGLLPSDQGSWARAVSQAFSFTLFIVMKNPFSRRFTIYHFLLVLFILLSLWQSYYYKSEMQKLHSMYQGIIEGDSNPVVEGLNGYRFLIHGYMLQYGKDQRVRAALKTKQRNAAEFLNEITMKSELNPDDVNFRTFVGNSEATRHFVRRYVDYLPGTEQILGLMEAGSR